MLQRLDLQKITIPLPFRLDHVHCFLAAGENGYTIIDTGLNDEAAKQIWGTTLTNKKIEQIILTHVHPDHNGYAGTLQRSTGAKVMMSEIDSKAMHTIWQDTSIPLLEKDYASFAVPNKMTSDIIGITKQAQNFVHPLPEVTGYLTDGEQIKIGKYMYDIITTPGHAEGLICLYEKENRVLLSTDHILPKITPNIAYWFYGEANPLLSYKHSLEKIKRLQVDYVIPSHGDPFEDVNGRIDEIWAHHEERLEVTYEAMKTGLTVFEMCQILFPYELSTYDYQFAIGETVAHMEYLRYEGKCIRNLNNGIWVYESN